MESLAPDLREKVPSGEKSLRRLLELLHEQQEPFMLKDFLTERRYLQKRSEGADGAIKKSGTDLTKPCRMAVRRSGLVAAAPNSEPPGPLANKNTFSFPLPFPDSPFPGGRSHGRPQCFVSSPLRSPAAKSSCIQSPSRGAARLLEAAVRILEPGLHTCSRPRPSFSFPQASARVPTTVRYLLEMDRRAANCSNKRRKRLRKKNQRKAQLDLALHSDETNSRVGSQNGGNSPRGAFESHTNARECSHGCAEGSFGGSDPDGDKRNVSDMRKSARTDDSPIAPPENGLNAWQRASEALISAFRLSPGKDPAGSIQKKEGSLIQYSRIFGFSSKVKKADKGEENTEACLAQKSGRYSLLKSILKRLSPSKESANEAPGKSKCPSERIESRMQSASVTGNISKRFSNAMRSFSWSACRPELHENDQVRLRIRDIVRWGSFDESEARDSPVGQSSNRLSEEKRVSLECPRESFADVMAETCLSAEAEMGPRQMKFASKRNVDDWQALLKGTKDVSSDFSTTSSSSAWFESCLDSDAGSASLDVLSSNGSSEASGSSDSRELKGMDVCVLEASSIRGHLSLEVDENGGVTDFRHSPRYDVNKQSVRIQLCDQIEGIAASDAPPGPGYLHCSLPLPWGFDTLRRSDDKGSPENSVIQARACRLSSDNISPSCEGIQEETIETIPCIGDNISSTRGVECNQNDNCKEVSDMGCFEEVEQLSPVSVLESPFEEESLGFEESLANIQRAKQQLLEKICEYERLAHMDPLLLEKRIASWKEEPSDDETYSNCTDEDGQRTNMIAEPIEMDWEEVGPEDYAREVFNCSHTVSEDLTSIASSWGCLDHCSCAVEDFIDRKMQVCTGSCYQSRHFPSQGLKAKRVSKQARKLLFDRGNEELQPAGKYHGSGLMAEPWLRDQLGMEHLAKKICGQIRAWKGVDTNRTDMLVALDLNTKGEEWRSFREDAEEIGAKIELAIFGVLVEEVLVDLAHFHTHKGCYK